MASRYTFANENLNNQKLKFLSGSQSNLSTLIANGGATEGAFYLTTDTHRLYIGRTITTDGGTKTIPIPVNECITTVANTNALNNTNANIGEFYYVENGNILAVKSSTGWVQLNSDTNDTIEVSSISLVKDSTQSNANAISYTLTINQTKKDKDGSDVATQPAAVTTSLTILKSDIIAAISVGIGSKAVSGNSTEISLSGNGADTSKKVTITGAGSVALSGNANNITITGTNTTYELGSAANSTAVTLTTNGSNDQDNVTFGVKANTENLAIDGSTAGQINYYHTGAGTAVGSPAGANTAGDLNFGSSFKVPSISKDANGHIVSLSDVSLTLPNVGGQTPQSISADNTGKIHLLMEDNTPYNSGADLYYTIAINGAQPTPIYNQGYLGSFYDADRVEERITEATKGINAMTYKGTVGNASSTVGNAILPTSNVSIGDTYLVNADSEITTNSNNVLSKKGDLYIAVSSDGTEDKNGHIDSSKLGWTRVEAGDVDTQYTFNNTLGSNPSLQSTPKTDSSNPDNVQIAGGDHIAVTGTARKITIDHSAPDNTNTIPIAPSAPKTGVENNKQLDFGGKLNIPSFSYDSKGHIASASTEEFTLPSGYTLNHNTSDDNTGTSDTTIRLWKGTTNTGIGSVTLEGDGGVISTASSANGIKISHATKTVNTSSDSTAADIPATGIEVVTEVGYDSYGHINKYVTHKYKVPTAVTYGLYDGIDDTTNPYTADTIVNNVAWQLKDSANTIDGLGEIITLGSDSLQLKRTGASAYKADIVWGSF